MAKSTTQATKRVSLATRLSGTKSFNCGPYKDAHVAQSYASQVRRAIKALPEGEIDLWSVKVNVETFTVRVNRAK